MAQVLGDVPEQVVADGVGVPVGPGEQVLHPIRGGLPEVLGELPSVLPPGLAQQPTDVPGRPPPGLAPGEPPADPLAHRGQLVGPLGDLPGRRSS